ncbi:uncharacterized conserved protein [Gluconobacter frateurii NBRC 103465]|nr:uncharacterized conserved protein [Gluconobacter frateurii NBRC 103465]
MYCDDSLRSFEQIIPAGGATNASVILTPQRLAELTSATWVKVST